MKLPNMEANEYIEEKNKAEHEEIKRTLQNWVKKRLREILPGFDKLKYTKKLEEFIGAECIGLKLNIDEKRLTGQDNFKRYVTLRAGDNRVINTLEFDYNMDKFYNGNKQNNN